MMTHAFRSGVGPVCCWSVPSMPYADINRQTFKGLAWHPTLILTRQFLTAVEYDPIDRLQLERGFSLRELLHIDTLFYLRNTITKRHSRNYLIFIIRCCLHNCRFFKPIDHLLPWESSILRVALILLHTVLEDKD